VSPLVVVPSGGLARVGSNYATYPTYADFLHELADRVGGLTLYASVFGPEHQEYEYFSQRVLDATWCTVVPLSGHSRGEPGPRLILNYLRQFWNLLRDAGGWQSALLYSPSATTSFAALAIRLRARQCRVVTYVWGDWNVLSQHLPQLGLTRRALNLFQARFIVSQERWLVARSVGTLVTGAVLRERYQGLGRRVVETVPMLDLAGLRAASSKVARDPHRLLYVGRLVDGKGLELLFESIAALKKARPRLALRVVGGGDRAYLAVLEALVRRLGLEATVTFAGVVANGPLLWDEYLQAGVFVLPSLSEGFPRVVYEAMATATPMVVTDVGSVARVVRAGVDGVIVPPGDEARLRAAIAELLDDPERRTAMGRSARAAFDVRFLVDRTPSTAEQVAALLSVDD
jgi:glycosyltransferase involved in cell wall biosynthesis